MTASGTVLILEPGYADYEVERNVFASLGVTVVPVPEAADVSVAFAEHNPVGLMVREHLVTAEMMEQCPQLKGVVRYGVGVDNIDLAAAKARGVKVANVPDYGAENEVSDHAVALYLAVARRVVMRDRAVRDGVWGIGQRERIAGHRRGVLGLIGYGRIARQAHRKFQALGFETVLVYDPHVSADVIAAAGAECVDLDTLFTRSDLVSLHVPYLTETRHIVDARRLSLMKPDAVLVNVSRGGLIDEEALAKALTDGTLFGAGLDVFEQEPPKLDHPLFNAPNTIVSDHTAWYSEQSVSILQENGAMELRRILSGEDPKSWVNR